MESGGSRKGKSIYALRHNTAHDHAGIKYMIGCCAHLMYKLIHSWSYLITFIKKKIKNKCYEKKLWVFANH